MRNSEITMSKWELYDILPLISPPPPFKQTVFEVSWQSLYYHFTQTGDPSSTQTVTSGGVHHLHFNPCIDSRLRLSSSLQSMDLLVWMRWQSRDCKELLRGMKKWRHLGMRAIMPPRPCSFLDCWTVFTETVMTTH